MSHLIQLRNRIKTTELTKKTTNAMRLIAMSTRTHLRQIKSSLELYKNNIVNALKEISFENNKNDIIKTGKKILIVVGSQKGLCGSFNATMASYYFQQSTSYMPYELIIIGKQIKERLTFQGVTPLKSFDQFSINNLEALVSAISSYALSPQYDEVVIFYTRPKTFFMQSHEVLHFSRQRFQFNSQDQSIQHSTISEQSYGETYNFLGRLYLKTLLEELLIDSLTAEASSRFLSMDAATRNADDIIASMKLDYNKLRQTAITRELTDLAGIYMPY